MQANCEALHVERRDCDDGRVRLVIVATSTRLDVPVQFTFLLPRALAAALRTGLTTSLKGTPYAHDLDDERWTLTEAGHALAADLDRQEAEGGAL